jgi:hypothetical protein
LKRRRFEAEPAISLYASCQDALVEKVLEERDAPDQIVIDARYCILLALGIYLKAWMASKSEPQTGIYMAKLTNRPKCRYTDNQSNATRSEYRRKSSFECVVATLSDL